MLKLILTRSGVTRSSSRPTKSRFRSRRRKKIAFWISRSPIISTPMQKRFVAPFVCLGMYYSVYVRMLSRSRRGHSRLCDELTKCHAYRCMIWICLVANCMFTPFTPVRFTYEVLCSQCSPYPQFPTAGSGRRRCHATRQKVVDVFA